MSARRPAIPYIVLAASMGHAALSPRPGFEIAPHGHTPLPAPALAMAFVDPDHLAVLFAEKVILYRWEPSGPAAPSERPLPGPFVASRAASGLIATADNALWVLTNRSAGAALFAIEKGRLVERAGADAMPWPGTPAGLRYRPGTNLLEGIAGKEPVLALAQGDGGTVIVGADGRLRRLEGRDDTGDDRMRVGPTLAPLWPGILATSSARPPGPEDEILLVDVAGETPKAVGALRVEGAVRALAARVHGSTARLVAAVEGPQGDVRLLNTEILRRAP